MKPIIRLSQYTVTDNLTFTLACFLENKRTHQKYDTKQSHLGLYLVVTDAAIGKTQADRSHGGTSSYQVIRHFEGFWKITLGIVR